MALRMGWTFCLRKNTPGDVCFRGKQLPALLPLPLFLSPLQGLPGPVAPDTRTIRGTPACPSPPCLPSSSCHLPESCCPACQQTPCSPPPVPSCTGLGGGKRRGEGAPGSPGPGQSPAGLPPSWQELNNFGSGTLPCSSQEDFPKIKCGPVV